MGTNNTRMGNDRENDIHATSDNRLYTGKPNDKHYWNLIHHSGWNNYFQMAEIKLLLHYMGFGAYILGILANLGNIVSFTMGLVGLAWAFFMMLKKQEDWKIRKIERKEMERDFKKNDK